MFNFDDALLLVRIVQGMREKKTLDMYYTKAID